MKRLGNQGFTLLELLVVGATISVLMTLYMSRMFKARDPYAMKQIVSEMADSCAGMKQQLNLSPSASGTMHSVASSASRALLITNKKDITYSGELMDQCSTHPNDLRLTDLDSGKKYHATGKKAQDVCNAFHQMMSECGLSDILPVLIAEARRSKDVTAYPTEVNSTTTQPGAAWSKE